MLKRFFAGICLLLSVGLLLGGCSGKSCKDTFISAYNDSLQFISGFSLTSDNDLAGTRQKGEDNYTGSYQADYLDFTGQEILFGGTGLERETGNQLTVTYSLQVDSGEGGLYWLNKEGPHPLQQGSGSGTLQIQLSDGDNYLVSAGKEWTGSISLTVS